MSKCSKYRITICSDEEDIVEEGRTINNQGYNYNSYGGYEDEEGANDEIQLMRIRPKVNNTKYSFFGRP